MTPAVIGRILPRLGAGAVCLLLNLATCIHAKDTAFLFTYFVGNGADGLHLMASTDGLKWESLGGGRSFLKPAIGTKEKLMRDPCVVQGPDGTYHLVWTSGWWERGIGYASTRDFIHWSEQREIPVMALEPAARNSWAPELIYDERSERFVIHWASTVPGRYAGQKHGSEDGLNHRIYATTTADFRDFSPARLWYDPGFSCIDATLLRFQGGLYWIIKDETRYPEPKKHLRIAKMDTVNGPWGELGAPFTPDRVWVEGPTAVQIGDWAYVYFDLYADKRYGVMRSRDLVHWEDLSSQLVLPGDGTPTRPRHGTLIEVPQELLQALQAHAP